MEIAFPCVRPWQLHTFKAERTCSQIAESNYPELKQDWNVLRYSGAGSYADRVKYHAGGQDYKEINH